MDSRKESRMPRPEDRFTNDVASAAAYERWRSRDDDVDTSDHDEARYNRNLARQLRCSCNSASESPCSGCELRDELAERAAEEGNEEL